MEYYSATKNNEFMKFLGKWMEVENIILSEVTQSQKNTHGIHSLISGYYPKAPNNQDTIHRPHEAQAERRPKCVYFSLLRRRNKIPMGGDTETKCGAETEEKAI